jgi:hypothetical protein
VLPRSLVAALLGARSTRSLEVLVLRRILRFGLIGVGSLIVLFVGLVVFSLVFPPTYEAVASLPGTTSTVIVELEPSHPYLAEYRRALVLRSPSAKDLRVDMFPDTGGYSRTQLYALPGERFLVRGFFDIFEVDPLNRKITPLQDGDTTGVYLGAFVSDDAGWRFASPEQAPEQELRPRFGSSSNSSSSGREEA